MMEPVPPVAVSDKFYDGEGSNLAPQYGLRPHPTQYASEASSVLAPELERDTMNRQLASEQITNSQSITANFHV
jgi:hypothetical protein